MHVVDDGLLVGAVGVHAPQLAAAQEGDALAVGGERHAGLRVGGVGQLRGLEVVRLDQFRVLGVVRL
jgi:hypothetical protein